jgi:AMMECR1 domain-containing protein
MVGKRQTEMPVIIVERRWAQVTFLASLLELAGREEDVRHSRFDIVRVRSKLSRVLYRARGPRRVRLATVCKD